MWQRGVASGANKAKNTKQPPRLLAVGWRLVTVFMFNLQQFAATFSTPTNQYGGHVVTLWTWWCRAV